MNNELKAMEGMREIATDEHVHSFECKNGDSEGLGQSDQSIMQKSAMERT